ncbi:phosphopantetheine-binding protein [Actinomadura fulvescens]|uniref:Carrier domain-containing protein n=1 Tax=Actinomadura fulvescens TaxID=46160 RepID=A0ABP6CF78_9ACTN
MHERISVAAMTEVWRDALGVTAAGPGDNFFDLGGQSMAAARIVQRVEDLAGIRLPVPAVFDHPTAEALTILVNESTDGTAGLER